MWTVEQCNWIQGLEIYACYYNNSSKARSLFVHCWVFVWLPWEVLWSTKLSFLKATMTQAPSPAPWVSNLDFSYYTAYHACKYTALVGGQRVIVLTWIEAVLSFADRGSVAHHCLPILRFNSLIEKAKEKNYQSRMFFSRLLLALSLLVTGEFPFVTCSLITHTPWLACTQYYVLLRLKIWTRRMLTKFNNILQ